MASQSGKMSAGEPQQQRRTPSYPFVATAAILPEAGAPIGGNMKELSLHGCYLDAATTLAARSRMLVKIFMPGEYFEANATVAYANPGAGAWIGVSGCEATLFDGAAEVADYGDAGESGDEL